MAKVVSGEVRAHNDESRLWLSDLCVAALLFFYSLNFGPMFFESWTSDRLWASRPPDSFYMFLGQYGQKTAHYWRVVSPLALAGFVISLLASWRFGGRRRWLVLAFVLYISVQLSTMLYFVPEQESLIASADAFTKDVLQARADRWILLNYGRNVAAMLAFAFLLRAAFVRR